MSKRLHCKKKLIASFIATTLASTAGMPSVGWAQTAEASLRGRAPTGSEVTARNVETGLTRHTKTDADGTYTLVGLPPGTYHVDAGPGTETTIQLTVASTTTLDLEPGAAAEAPEAVAEGPLSTVTVTGRRVLEVRTSEVGTTISQIQIETIPQITRNFLEFADTVPGMVFSVDSQGSTSLRGGAQTTSSVNVFVDGVGQKNYVKEGGVSGQFFTQGNPFPQLAIGEYKVITSNYKAEYDQISSAAVTAETKSGTNQFRGDIVGTYTGQNFRAETPGELAAGKKTQSQDKEYGAAFGGPIIPDVAHFFVTYEGKRFTTPVTVTSGAAIANIASLLPPSVAAQFGPADLPFDEDLYFGKLDWEPTGVDRFELSAKVRRESARKNIGIAAADSSSIDVIDNDTRIDARWDRSADRWFNQLRVVYEDAYDSPTARGLGNGSIYTYKPNNDQTIIDVGPSPPGATQNKAQRGPGLQDDLTLTGLTWRGDHTVKTGVKIKRVTLTAQDAENINPQFFYSVDQTGAAPTPWKAQFTNPVAGLNAVAESRNTQFGVYIQDDWLPTEKLTLNIGVRWDYERTPSYLDHVTPANVLAALNGPDPAAQATYPGQTYAQTLAKGGININDYIGNGNNRSAAKDEIQPRFGVAYDLNGDQQHVIFGGAGRAYDRDLYDYLQLEETKAALPTLTVNFNVPDHPCNPQTSSTCFAWDPKYLNGLQNLQALVAGTNVGKEVDMLNNHLKVPYSDQFSIGMRNKVGDWNTSATVARILSHDGFVFTLGNRYPDGAFWMNGGQPWGNGVPGFGALIIGNNGIETRTTQFLLSAEKLYTGDSHWGATFAYTYTMAKQNRDTNEHYAFDEETIQQYPFILSNAVARHRFVAAGTVTGPWGTTLAGKLTVSTPIPKNDITNVGIVYANGSHATPIAGTPPQTFGYRELDLQVSKDVQVANFATLYVRFDVLNVFDYYNYSDYIVNWGGNGVYNSNPVTYNSTGNISGVPRTFKMTMGVKF